MRNTTTTGRAGVAHADAADGCVDDDGRQGRASRTLLRHAAGGLALAWRNRRHGALSVLLALALGGPAVAAEHPGNETAAEQAARIPLWPDPAPGSVPGPDQARIVERSDDPAL
ncbi:hypothetical protein Y886_16300, partial [Xanthomonas hyacinthi DSM 19077]